MSIWWLGALCIIQSCVIFWMRRLLCLKTQQSEYYWAEMIDRESRVREMEHDLETYDEELAKLRSTEKTLREANKPGQDAIDFVAGIAKSCKDFCNAQSPF